MRPIARLIAILALLTLTGCTTVGPAAPTGAPTAAPFPAPAATETILPALPLTPAATETALPPPAPTLAAASPLPSPAAAAAPTHLVLISIDGGRPEYFDLADMPNLRALMANGTYYPSAWVGALPNNTPPGHTEMSTGSFPKRNGILGYLAVDPASGEPFDPTTLEAVQAGRMAAVVAHSGVPTLAGLFKSKDPAAQVIALSTHKSYAAQALGMGPADGVYYTVEDPPQSRHWRAVGLGGHALDTSALDGLGLEADIASPGEDTAFGLRIARALFESYEPRALLINLPEADVAGHELGGLKAPDTMRAILEAVDAGLGELMTAYDAAGILDQTLWVITADHGMTDKQNIIIPAELFERLAIDTGADRPALPEMTLSDPSSAAAIAETIAASRTAGITGVYFKTVRDGQLAYQAAPSTRASLLPELNAAYLSLLDTVAASASPDLVAMTAEGWAFDKRMESPGGSHNMINWADQHIPILFSGPGVLPAQISYSPARLVDLLPTVAALIGLPDADMDGVVLADALAAPSPQAVAAQEQVNARLAPQRDALEISAR